MDLGKFAALAFISDIEPSTILVLHLSQIQIGSGVPQNLCLEITQSLDPISQSEKRFFPAHSGTQRILSFSSSSLLLMSAILTNHCSVARWMSGVLHRQQ